MCEAERGKREFKRLPHKIVISGIVKTWQSQPNRVLGHHHRPVLPQL
jgi:hypothetical protein